MTKRIDVIQHFAMECNQLGQIRFTCNASAMNVVDMLTKALFKTVLEQHQAALGLLIT